MSVWRLIWRAMSGTPARRPTAPVPTAPPPAAAEPAAPQAAELARARPHARRLAVGVVCVTWFALAFAGILWSWHGHDPLYFASPDEAVDRKAAERVASTGLPAVDLASDDPEDMRHGRFWVSMDGEAIPAYPPVAYYLQGLLLMPPGAGAVLVAMLGAIGVAAFAGAVCLLGSQRPWVALFAPVAAFPALYWLMRPWINISTLLTFLCVSLFCWAAWRRNRAPGWLAASATAAGVAAAVRPDYAPLILMLGAAATFAESRSDERRPVVLALAGTFGVAVGLNLALNAVTTGDPFTAAYEIVDDRRGGVISGGLPAPFSKFSFLLLPYGVPPLSEVADQFERYWLDLGPIKLVTFGSVAATLLLLRSASRQQRVAYGACVMISAVFVLTHVSDAVYGASDPSGLLRHSVTRYWTPVYLLAAVPLLLLAMSRVREGAWVAALAVLCVVSVLGGREVYDQQPESLSDLRAMQRANAERVAGWEEVVPTDAVVYSYNLDKILWPHWEVATLSQSARHEASAASLSRAVDSGRAVYIVQVRWPDAYFEGLSAALADRGLKVTAVADDASVFAVSERSVTGSVSSELRR